MAGQSNNREMRVDIMNARRHTHGPTELDIEKKHLPKVSSRSSDFVYVNTAYVGSTNALNQPRINNTSTAIIAPTNSVYREQYWACSKWPFGQRVLAIAVGLLLGTIVGLAIVIALSSKDDIDLDIFRTLTAPD